MAPTGCPSPNLPPHPEVDPWARPADRRLHQRHRGKFTREAITQQLLEAGYEQGAIDATWAVLDTPDPDDVVGEGFWGRFWIYLIGLNVVALLSWSASRRSLIPNAVGLAAVLGVVLAIGAAIALGIVALIHPIEAGRGTAIAIGGIVPLIFTLLIAGCCYALMSSLGPAAPPLSGTLTLQVDPPPALRHPEPRGCSRRRAASATSASIPPAADQLERGPRQRRHRRLSPG